MRETTRACIRLCANQKQIDRCKEILEKKQGAFDRLSHLLSLTGNEARLKMLFLLAKEGELCPCDLSDMLELSVPAVSQHLRKMKDGGIVQSRREGQTIFYSIRSEQFELLSPLFQQIVHHTQKELA